MAKQRISRINSLLKEVISEIIRREVRNPHVNELVTVTRVDVSKDLYHAKVYISVIGSQAQKPLAIVVVGGMLVAMLLAQFLIPVLYTFAPAPAGQVPSSLVADGMRPPPGEEPHDQ